jgi:hypothetical protein
VIIAATASASETENSKKAPEKKPEIQEHSPSLLLSHVDKDTISFAAAPATETAVNTGPVTFYILNNSEKEFVCTCLARTTNGWQGLQRGVIAGRSVLEAGTFRRDELMDISAFLIQGFTYNEGINKHTSTIRKEIQVQLPGFQDKINGINGRLAFARISTVYSEATAEPDELKLLKEKYESDAIRSALLSGKTSSQRKKPKSEPDDDSLLITEKIIDLHIEELIEDPSRLSNAEIINIQMKRFHEEMDSAMRNYTKRIFFIHGVGNGTLKSNIRQELRAYPGVAFRDADFRKFGSGATEVILNDR